MERTLILLKPDCVQRRLMGEIIARFERKGLNIIGLKMLQVTPELAKRALCRTRREAVLSRDWKPSSRGPRWWRWSSRAWKRFA